MKIKKHFFQKQGMNLINMESGIWLSAATCFMLFLYAPLELLFTNQDEFWFDAYILTPVMFVVFVIVLAVSIVFFVLLDRWGERPYRVGLAVYFTAFICTYVQGNFLAGGLPALDGTAIDWSLYTAERIKSIVLWVGVAALVVIAFRKMHDGLFEKMVQVVSICMMLMLLITLGTLAVSNHGFEKKPSMSVTRKDIFEMSQTNNFVILLLDAVDAETLENMMSERTEYRDIFEDFTFYDNVVAAYPYTKHSIPYILSGEWFENETEFRDYEVQAYATSPLFERLESAGYKMAVYDAELLLDDGGMGRFENILPNDRGVADKWAFARWQILMTGFKYAPYDLKRICVVNPEAFNDLKITPEGETLFTASNTAFYDEVRYNEVTYTDENWFKFIHIDGGHLPFRYDENVNVIDEEKGSYEGNLQACLTITRDYLSKLKESGVYNNSVIIVMADHGYNGFNNPYGRQNPIFFVKGIGEQHELYESDAPISFVDLQDAYQRLLDGQDGDRIFDWQSGDYRERRFLFYEYLKEDYMVEYIQPGYAHDTDMMYQTGNIYAQ